MWRVPGADPSWAPRLSRTFTLRSKSSKSSAMLRFFSRTISLLFTWPQLKTSPSPAPEGGRTAPPGTRHGRAPFGPSHFRHSFSHMAPAVSWCVCQFLHGISPSSHSIPMFGEIPLNDHSSSLNPMNFHHFSNVQVPGPFNLSVKSHRLAHCVGRTASQARGEHGYKSNIIHNLKNHYNPYICM